MKMRIFSTEESEMLHTIITNLCEDNRQWFIKQNITVDHKPPYWILNYGPGKRTEYNPLCRGLVVRFPTFGPKTTSEAFELIHSFPFTRFYNHNEKEAAKVNLNNADMIEKLDGTMVGVFFPKTGYDFKNPQIPYWHTRKMICTHKPDMELEVVGFHGNKSQLLRLIGENIQFLKFHRLDVNYTFIFEFIHDATHVLTKYSKDQQGLYLIGSRNINNFNECTEDQLDKIAERIGAKRPRRWDSIDDANIIDKMMQQASIKNQNFEGFVFRDRRSYERIKVKNPKYVKLHRMLDLLSYKKLISLVLEGEAEEILAYFPTASKQISEIAIAYEKYKEKAIRCVTMWRDRLSQGLATRKAIATSLFDGNHARKSSPDPFICSLIMKGLEQNDNEILNLVEDAMRAMCIGKGKNEGSPRRLLELIGLRDKADLPGENIES